MKAIIVEDELLIAEQLHDILVRNHCEVLAVAQNSAEATIALQQKPDFVLLDIQLKSHSNGIEFGKILHSQMIPFIYITANTEINTLKEAVKTNPVTYISKPFKSTDVIAAVELVKLKQNLRPRIVFEGATKDTEVFLEDILYCEAKGSYTEIVTSNHTFTKRINLKDLLLQLDNTFVRTHRSFVVNRHKVTRKTFASIFLGKIEIPISKSYKNDF